ncbi:hypothetical protein ACET3Z_017867 [Daucus carota]
MQLLSAVVSLLFLIFPASPASAHNITAILNNFPEFSIFNHHLTKTHLAAKINRHNNITVCAIDNAGMTAFLSAPIPFSAMKRFLSVHVLRDYLGAEKLQQISDGTALAVPMFHSRGARKFNIIVQYDGSEVTLKTKLMDAKIIDALYDKQPLAVYKLDNILLPRELFRANIPKPEKMKIQQKGKRLREEEGKKEKEGKRKHIVVGVRTTANSQGTRRESNRRKSGEEKWQQALEQQWKYGAKANHREREMMKAWQLGQ